MNFKEQVSKLPVSNIDPLVGENIKEFDRHGPLLPNNIRAVVCGPSGCGKTNALISLIIHPNGIKFENVYIYSKSLYQPKYKFLEKLLRPIKEICYFPFSDRDQVISPNDAKINSIMIFDDIACEKQDCLKAFFCMGRHKNLDCFYLCQSYAQVPKHLVRDNLNFLVLFRQDDLNLRHIFNDHVTTDMSFEKFKQLCSHCWEDMNHGFTVIDKTKEIGNGRYRKGFDQFLIKDSEKL